MESAPLKLIVPTRAAGKRLDIYLCEALSNQTRNHMQHLIDAGAVLVDNRLRPAGHKLRGGESITVDLPDETPQTLSAESIPLEIVYEDAYLLVINKPTGLVVHPGAGHHSGTLVNALLARNIPLSNLGDPQRPGIVHRLDKETSGLLLIAKDNATHTALAKMLQERRISRRYLALVWGEPREASFSVEATIGRKPSDRKQMAVVAAGRQAHTDFEVKERLGEFTLLEASLATGRTHQVRVHLAYLGLPVVGDPTYGRRVARHEAARLDQFTRILVDALPGQALHAWRLTLPHPSEDRLLDFKTDPPAAFAQLLAHLRFRSVK
jgi:23S rRNA pseudouridine1911/1915/1917 synthase